MAHFTEQAIKLTFLKLLDEKPLSKITVKDIADGCGINRNSFYYHYQDIPTLLRTIIDEEAEKVFEAYPSIDTFDLCAKAIMDYANRNKRLILHVFNSVNQSVIIDNLMQLCDEIVGKYMSVSIRVDAIRTEDIPILHRFLKSLMFGLVVDWLKDGMKEDAEAVLERMLQLSSGVSEVVAENSFK